MRISKKIATAAAALALAAGLLAPTASAACPYTVGPLGRYIAPTICFIYNRVYSGPVFNFFSAVNFHFSPLPPASTDGRPVPSGHL